KDLCRLFARAPHHLVPHAPRYGPRVRSDHMPTVLFAENWDTIVSEGPRLWLRKKRLTECMPVEKFGQEHHARHIGMVRPHAMHAEEKDRRIFKFRSQGSDKPIDSLINRANALGSRP